MKYAYFPGCKIAHHLPAHGKSVEAVCARLDIDLARPEPERVVKTIAINEHE